MAVNPADISRVVANMVIHGETQQKNVWYVKNKTLSAVDDDDYRTHISKWLDAAYSCIVAQLHNGVVFDSISIYNITQDRPLPDVGWDTLSAGTLVENDLPPAVAALLVTDTATKRTTGKKYIGGFGISAVNDFGQWTSTILTVLACMALKLFGNQTFFSITSQPGVWKPLLETWHEFESCSIDGVPATQRRRRPGTGE